MSDTSEDSTNWELPRGRFYEVLASSGDISCPAAGCSSSYKKPAEYKRHVGCAHLKVWRCVTCYANRSDKCDYGRKDDLKIHIKTQHRSLVNSLPDQQPVNGTHYRTVPQRELNERAQATEFKY